MLRIRLWPLTQIHSENLDRLALTWYADMGTIRGLEATPLVVDGRMFVKGHDPHPAETG